MYVYNLTPRHTFAELDEAISSHTQVKSGHKWGK